MADANTDGSSEAWLKWRCLHYTALRDHSVLDQETCGKAYEDRLAKIIHIDSTHQYISMIFFEMSWFYHRMDRVLSEVFLESVLPKLLTSAEEDLCSQFVTRFSVMFLPSLNHSRDFNGYGIPKSQRTAHYLILSFFRHFWSNSIWMSQSWDIPRIVQLFSGPVALDDQLMARIYPATRTLETTEMRRRTVWTPSTSIKHDEYSFDTNIW